MVPKFEEGIAVKVVNICGSVEVDARPSIHAYVLEVAEEILNSCLLTCVKESVHFSIVHKPIEQHSYFLSSYKTVIRGTNYF